MPFTRMVFGISIDPKNQVPLTGVVLLPTTIGAPEVPNVVRSESVCKPGGAQYRVNVGGTSLGRVCATQIESLQLYKSEVPAAGNVVTTGKNWLLLAVHVPCGTFVPRNTPVVDPVLGLKFPPVPHKITCPLG